MSTAHFVPETWHLDDRGPWHATQALGVRRLAVGAFVRLRAADGTSHARSMAFLVALIAIQGLIAVVGLMSTIDDARFAGAARGVVQAVAPGPVGEALNTAIDQARQAGRSDLTPPSPSVWWDRWSPARRRWGNCSGASTGSMVSSKTDRRPPSTAWR